MEEYSFEEVIANIKIGETYICKESGYVIKTIYKSEGGFRFNNNEPMDFCGINNMQRFVKVEKPVSFDDVLKSDKKCRVEHDLVISTKEYEDFDILIADISNVRDAQELKDIMLNGKWYLEE